MNPSEGDIIYTTCSGLPACYHVGVVVADKGRLCVYHNTPTLKNNWGGNVVAQPLEDFLIDRKVIKIVKAGIQPDIVKQHAFDNRFKKWEVFYNCEDFVNEAHAGNKGSPFRELLIAGLSTAAILAI